MFMFAGPNIRKMRRPCSRPQAFWLAAIMLLFLVAPASLRAGGWADPTEQPRAEVVEGEVGRAMNQYLRRAAALGFGGQVLVEKEGKVILHAAYGYADRRQRILVTTHTVFGIASMSKQFAAAAILKLEETQRL